MNILLVGKNSNFTQLLVEKLDKEFDLALIGTKGKWYDHKVSITDVQPQ